MEPDAGPQPVYALLSSPRASLDMTMYELEDATAESDLAADAARGVKVRVVLDQTLEASRNQAAYRYLTAHGVSVHWGPAGFHAVHEKAFVIDGATAVIMSMNLTIRYYSDTRDLVVVDPAPADVAAVEATFDADFAGGAGDAGAPPSPGADLIWSPGSEAAMVDLIKGAHRRVILESEEMSDSPVIDALAAAAQRGVDVTVVMTYDSEWSSAFSRLRDAGAHVRTYAASAPLYIHAKAIVIDGASAFVGSENLSFDSLNRDRELGLVTTQAGLVGGVASVLNADAAGATPYRG